MRASHWCFCCCTNLSKSNFCETEVILKKTLYFNRFFMYHYKIKWYQIQNCNTNIMYFKKNPAKQLTHNKKIDSLYTCIHFTVLSIRCSENGHFIASNIKLRKCPFGRCILLNFREKTFFECYLYCIPPFIPYNFCVYNFAGVNSFLTRSCDLQPN